MNTDKNDLTEDQQSEKLRAMFTNPILNVPLGKEEDTEKGDFNITQWDYSKSLPPKPLTKEQIRQLTPQQSADYFANQMVANLNNPEAHGKST